MPSLITHFSFGQDAFAAHADTIGYAKDCKEAFLLGNQGPDPLFYAVVDPRLQKHIRLGSLMHTDKPAELIAALRQAIDFVEPARRETARAYALGFIGHYLLDSTVHPLVYAQQNAICNAGVPGLGPKDHSEVHGTIERELDEMMLYTRTGRTISSFNPANEVLKASDDVLQTISQMYLYLALIVYEATVPKTFFHDCVRNFRTTQQFFLSTSGIKRSVVTRLETLVRTNSFYSAMSHRDVERAETPFENRANDPWADPDTGITRTESFGELYAQAAERIPSFYAAFLAEGFTLEDAVELTGNICFDGNRTVAPSA